MRIILSVLAVFCLSMSCFGQSGQNPPPQQPSEEYSISQPPNRSFPISRGVKPKISLRKALKLAEDYFKREKITFPTFFLSEVKLIRYDIGRGLQEWRWLLTWAHESGVGLTMQYMVKMNGKVIRSIPPQGASNNSFNRSGN